jgi:hypothetical protein
VTVYRLLPAPWAGELIELVRHLADREPAPVAAKHERAGRLPRRMLRTPGEGTNQIQRKPLASSA